MGLLASAKAQRSYRYPFFEIDLEIDPKRFTGTKSEVVMWGQDV